MDDFHVLDVNVNFALVKEVNVEASQLIGVFSPPVQQVMVIHDLGYVSTKYHSDYVLEINIRIKQDHTPSMPLGPDQVCVSLPKETIHGNIPWSNASIDENKTIDPIVNAMTSTKVVLHILQQGPSESTPSFETHDQTIRNISKDINVVAKKQIQTQKWKEPKAKPRRMKAYVKTVRKKIVKKGL